MDAQHPLLEGHPVLLLAQVLAALCYALAAVFFTRQAVRSHDELLSWLGPAFVLGAFARLHYLLFPSLYTDWLYSGDLLRTGSHVLMLTGAVREIQQFWHAQTDIAVLEDRRRLARELHDGLVQEIAYIRLASHAIPPSLNSWTAILAACDRALDEARAAVHALGSDSDEPLGDTLERAVRQLAERYDVTVDFLVAESVPVDRKSTRLNSSHANISYAVFCLKKKKKISTLRDAAGPGPRHHRSADAARGCVIRCNNRR